MTTPAEHAHAAAARIANHNLSAIGNGLHDAQSHGYPNHSAGFGAIGGGGADVTLTGPEHIMANTYLRDRTRTDMADWQRALRMVIEAAHIFDRCASYAPHRPDGTAAACGNCATANITQDAHKAGLCRWCYDRHRKDGALPNAAAIRLHAMGGRRTA